MDFHILGPLEVLDEGRAITLAGSRQRTLLGVLLLHANETLSTDRLIDELWGAHPPATATKSVQVHISRLRKTLATNGDGDAAVLTREHGYELAVDPERVDSRRFERLLADGRAELAAGRPDRAVGALERALSLWRGAPFGDLGGEPFAEREIARLDELRVVASEQLVGAKLALGRHAEVVGELETLIAEHPYREGLRAQLMLALYRSDRQAEALQVYQDARRKLVEDLGIEPGERLRDLERAILAQDRALALVRRDAVDLPPELDTRVPLAGREAELAWLRERWRRASAGAGELVLVAGLDGMGKTRLVAELAVEVHRSGGAVRYAAGARAPEAVRAEPGPALLVCDDVDRAGRDVLDALGELADTLSGRAVLVVATAEDAALAARVRAAATLTLTPLDADGMRVVARLYADPREDAGVPLQWLAQASGGVPRRVHRVAGGWAHAATVRRVGAAARRAATERTDLRAAEDDVAGDVIALQAARERAELGAAGLVACPFKGLDGFDVEDADVFFGRERLIAEMVARLAGAPLMALVGSSGSGKSSALRAGLLAALAAGVLPGSEHWALVVLRPGEHPTRALEDATADVRPDGRIVVAVDQFEELFTACRAESERAAFVEALLAFVREPGRRAIVLVAVRADFYGRCAVYPELSRLLGANHVLVGPMRRDELRRAIELPARRAGLQVEPELVDALVADVEGEPGALPLLSTSLLELWRHRDGRALRMAAYEHTGGVHGAIARLAESAYERLDPERRAIARRILLRLAGEGEGDAVVRRRVPLSELEAERDEQVGEVLAALAAERLVTIGGGEAEVAHEALLREWPRLRGWLEEDAHGRRLRAHLRDAARQWDASGREPGELYRGARLASALDWAVSHDAELNGTERAFLREGRAASVRAQRRLRAVLAAVATLLVLAVVAGLVALSERGRARDEAVAADAQRLGASALIEDDLDNALLLARQGVALDDTLQTRGSLLAALLRSPAAIGVLRGDGDRLVDLALSPDGNTLAFVDHDGTLSFADVATRRPAAPPVALPGYTGVIIDAQIRLDHLQYSPDGTRIVAGAGMPVVLDARSHRVLSRLRTGGDGIMYGARFAPDGRTVFAAVGFPETDRHVLQRLDARTGRVLAAAPVATDDELTLMVTRDGRRLVTTSSSADTVVRDARTLAPLRRWPVRGAAAALSPDDRTMVAGAADGSVRFLDLVTGRVRRASGGHDGAVVHAAFSADGTTAITAGKADGMIIVWDVARATAGESFKGHAGQITGLTIAEDGATLYSSALDGRVLVWDLAGNRRLGRPFQVGPDNPDGPRYALSPDGRVLAVGQADGTVNLIDTRTLKIVKTFRGPPEGPVRGMGYVPRSGLLVVGGDDGFLTLVDPRDGRIVKRLGGHRGFVFTPGISADGRTMVTASGFDTVRLYALPSGRPVGPPLHASAAKAIGDVSMSPDGRTVAITRPTAGGVEIRDVPTLRLRAVLADSRAVWDLAHFTPDGRYIVGGSFKGWAQLWSTKTWRPVCRRFGAHAGRVEWQSTSPDGRMLATGGPEGAIYLWDMRTQQPLGAAIPGVPGHGVVPQFTPDGAYLFAITSAARAYRWDVRPSSWERHACGVAGRPLTRAEWADALPDREYAPACR